MVSNNPSLLSDFMYGRLPASKLLIIANNKSNKTIHLPMLWACNIAEYKLVSILNDFGLRQNYDVLFVIAQ
jgi:hypothetical protein